MRILLILAIVFFTFVNIWGDTPANADDTKVVANNEVVVDSVGGGCWASAISDNDSNWSIYVIVFSLVILVGLCLFAELRPFERE